MPPVNMGVRTFEYTGWQTDGGVLATRQVHPHSVLYVFTIFEADPGGISGANSYCKPGWHKVRGSGD